MRRCLRNSTFFRIIRNGIHELCSYQQFPRKKSSYPPRALRISEEVRNSVENHSPVIALESAIITHGMPYPHNVNTALNVQRIIREQGATPATVGVIKGQLIVGLSNEEIEYLGSPPQPENSQSVIKISRRDLPFALSQKLNGGTTVSGTIIAATLAKIPIFVTGGVGGVHRGAELTFDVSADLKELGRNPIAVVSAGVKSILDIGKTLEYLETEGVCVCVLNSDESDSREFPSFFTAKSRFKTPYLVRTEAEAAGIIHAANGFGLQSGILIAVPIPKEGETFGQNIEDAIQMALAKAAKLGIQGRQVTPFVLSAVNEITGGQSLEANKILIYNNAKVGGRIGLELSKLRGDQNSTQNVNSNRKNLVEELERERHGNPFLKLNVNFKPGRPVVIGGSSLDIIFAAQEDLVKDGRTHRAQIETVPGGVGRNMAEALALLGQNPLFISAVGTDFFGQEILKSCTESQLDTSGISVSSSTRTAVYSAVLDSGGECAFGLGHMIAHDTITPTILGKYEEEIGSASIVIMDGNIPVQAMSFVMEICTRRGVPVWFEPTELRKAGKLLQVPSEHWPCLTFVSPNLNELRMLSQLNVPVGNTQDEDVQSMIRKCFLEFTGLQLILLTSGKSGFSVITRSTTETGKGQFDLRRFPSPALVPEQSEVLRSVSGAGDCLNSGFISALLDGRNLEECSKYGTTCAKESLQSHFNVPNSLKPKHAEIAGK